MDYKESVVLLASKHEKEQAIAPPFFKRLCCTISVHDFDTDQFGTFTGETARLSSPYETCVLKAKTAAEQYGYRLALASEGSFGPHPALPFIPSAHELMVFIDRENSWIIAEQLISQNTNYAMMTVDAQSDLCTFLTQVGFPSHALTLQTTTDKQVLAKGIRDIDSLHAALNHGFKHHDKLFLATDMRAMMNPTRMNVLSALADQLALRIATLCPDCFAPGYGPKTTQGHLSCSLCGAPTSFYAHEVWGCIQCTKEEYKPRKDNLLEANPTYCNYCNP
jgi:hypothetical protein